MHTQTHRLLRMPRPTANSGLTLVEILIALFIFLVGILGVLSIFPVAMNSAGKTIGETRGNLLAQSGLAQITSDCHVIYDSGTVSAATGTSLTRSGSVSVPDGYFVTLTSGPAAGQSRAFTGGSGTTLTVSPAWNPIPPDGTRYVITRLGLPDAPQFGVDAHDFGLERVFFIRSFPDGPNGNRVELGRFDTCTPVLNGTADVSGNNTLNDSRQAWSTSPDCLANASVLLTSGTGAGQRRQIVQTLSATQISIAPNWTVIPDTSTHYTIQSIAPCYHRGGGVATGGAGASTLTETGQSWAVNAYVDQLVRITSGPGAGEVRRIIANTADTLYVSPPWNSSAMPDATSAYDIGWPANGQFASAAGDPTGFLVINSGRSAGRVFRILASAYAPSLILTLQDANFADLDLRPAQRQIVSSLTGNDYVDYSYKPSDTVTVSIIGNTGSFSTLLPSGTGNPNPVAYTAADFNTFSDPAQSQTRADLFGANDSFGSEYGATAIFSDGGNFPFGPIRVDLFVFRNYDSTLTPAKNTKPVAHMTGYIGRP